MLTRSSLYILLVLLVAFTMTGCSHQQIRLGIVRHVPYYFQNNSLFGENKKLMEEKNEFILATGMIDTTDETPPIIVALICINRQTMQLNLVSRKKENNEFVTEYAGNGYTLLLSSLTDQWQLIISHGNVSSTYRVFGRTGYY